MYKLWRYIPNIDNMDNLNDFMYFPYLFILKTICYAELENGMSIFIINKYERNALIGSYPTP